MPERNIVDGATKVEFVESRWRVTIRVTLIDGTVLDYVASADSGDTAGDGIWFGTRIEYEAGA